MVVRTFATEPIDEAELAALAARLAPAVRHGGVIHLAGPLGAGKTAFARALLQALGVRERIKSPTYSLIESYRVGDLAAHHLDLYRLADPEELAWLGVSDLADPAALMLVEWPERGAGALPSADLALELAYAGPRRTLSAVAHGPRGEALLQAAWRATPDT
ncbi:MAG TPA: tRNA (adenosine(37)-N6)-threonylcarbamoyltransferase complex ATPase subunit type 1 TsaE [Dokdonella sp.]